MEGYDTMDKIVKFLLVSDQLSLCRQMECMVSDINKLLYRGNKQCKMVCLEQAEGYKSLRMEMDKIFGQMHFVLFVMDHICTSPMMFVLEQIIKYKSVNADSKLEVLFFERKLWHGDCKNKTIEIARILVERETKAYLIPYYSFETIKFFFILEIHRWLLRNKYNIKIEVKNDLVFLEDHVLMSTKNFPEVLLNRELRICRSQMESVQKSNYLICEKRVQLEELQKKYNEIQKRLLACFQMINALLATWQSREIVKPLYDGIYNGQPIGWKGGMQKNQNSIQRL